MSSTIPRGLINCFTLDKLVSKCAIMIQVIPMFHSYQTSSSNPYLINSSSGAKVNLKSDLFECLGRTFNLVFADINMGCWRQNAGGKVIHHSRSYESFPFDVVVSARN